MNPLFTKWTAYGGKVGITENGDYHDLETGKPLHKEVFKGSLHYRAKASKKRFSYKKCNETKKLERIEIIKMPF